MNKNNSTPIQAVTRLAPRIATHPAGWLALGFTVAAITLSPRATAGDRDTEVSQARAEIEARRAEIQRHRAEIESERDETIAREIESAERALEHAENELQLAAERLAELSLKHEANAPRAFAYRLLGGRKRAMLGVTVRTADDESGVHVNGVTPGGPAEKAGIHAGDIITAANGERFQGEKALKGLSEFMEALEPGDEVELAVLRGGKRKQIKVKTDDLSWPSAALAAAPPVPPVPGVSVFNTDDGDVHCAEGLVMDLQDLGNGRRVIRIDPPVAPRPPLPPVPPSAEVASVGAGLTLAQLNKDLGSYFGTNTGVLVVASGDRRTMDLEPGDVIQSVNGQSVSRPNDVIRQLKRVEVGDAVTLDVMRRGARQMVTAARPDQMFNHVHVQSYASNAD
ncbi:PDZ domain-containing protein [uncultured Abyssibacter sp.]|uniref:PDZ domain-containing protein n=1 Tax=uncultured Abyssibacter sp. TaxID=2320202 RepID=UPI0032B1C7D0